MVPIPRKKTTGNGTVQQTLPRTVTSRGELEVVRKSPSCEVGVGTTEVSGDFYITNQVTYLSIREVKPMEFVFIFIEHKYITKFLKMYIMKYMKNI